MKYNLSDFGGIEKITTLDGKIIKSYLSHNIDVLKSHARNLKISDEPKYNMNSYPALGGGNKFRIVFRDAGLFANNYAYNADSNTLARYSFLQAGKYKIYYFVKFFDIVIRNSYIIEILPSTGENHQRFKRFIHALDYVQRGQMINCSADLVGKGNSSLLELLKEDLNGVYSETILSYILATGINPSIDLFRSNPFYQRKILEIIPQFLKGREWLSYYRNYFATFYIYEYYCHFAPDNCEEKFTFLDGMLQDLKNCSPIFCDQLIIENKKCCPDKNLKNYSRISAGIQK